MSLTVMIQLFVKKLYFGINFMLLMTAMGDQNCNSTVINFFGSASNSYFMLPLKKWIWALGACFLLSRRMLSFLHRGSWRDTAGRKSTVSESSVLMWQGPQNPVPQQMRLPPAPAA